MLVYREKTITTLRAIRDFASDCRIQIRPMTSLQTAIEDAVRGGWKWYGMFPLDRPLIDHLAQGGSVEEFFTNLTSKQ